MLAKPEYFSPPDEVCCWQGRRSGVVAGKGAVAELLLAWSRSGVVAGRGAVAERYREAAVGRGRYGGAVAGRGIAAEHCPSVNEIFYPFGCHQFTFFFFFSAVSALRL